MLLLVVGMGGFRVSSRGSPTGCPGLSMQGSGFEFRVLLKFYKGQKTLSIVYFGFGQEPKEAVATVFRPLY